MNYSEKLSKIVCKKNFAAVNAVILHLRHNSIHFKVRCRQKYQRNTKHVFVFSLCIHLFQTKIELPEGNKAICRNVSQWMGNLHTKICGAYLKRFSGLNSQREKKERYSYLYMFRKVVEVQSSNVLTSLLEIFIFGVTKKPQCFSYT